MGQGLISRWRRSLLGAGLLAVTLTGTLWGQDPADAEIRVLHVQGNVYMLVGADGNTAVQVGENGVLLVDTQFAESSGQVLAAVRLLSDKPIRYIINTHAHLDHVGGNAILSMAGSTTQGADATVIAHENVLLRMSAPTGSEPPMPLELWPTNTFFVPEKELFFNGEGIQILHQPAAHTDGDSIVFFRRSDVISAGDVFSTSTYPVIDAASGGSINGIIDALNNILDLIIPAHQQEGGTMIIPGHGRLADEHDVVEYRDMLTIIRDRIQVMIEEDTTLEEVKAARPTFEYDPRWGSDTGSWTTDMFIEAVYTDLVNR